MLAGSMVVTWITSPIATWTTLILLLSIHLGMNYRAVRAVTMRTLNRQRANIVLSHYITCDEILTPSHASAKESIFDVGNELRDNIGRVIGSCEMGATLAELVNSLGEEEELTKSVQLRDSTLNRLMALYRSERYIMWPEHGIQTARVILKENCTPEDQLKAWYHALVTMYLVSGTLGAKRKFDRAAKEESLRSGQDGFTMFKTVQYALEQTSEDFQSLGSKLRRAGWDLDTAALETHSGSRIAVDDVGPSGVGESIHQ